jgi:hypothetical protein
MENIIMANDEVKNGIRDFPATVVRLLENELSVVINRGYNDGVKQGQRFLIYNVENEPIIDPETNESLGCLEIVRGTGKVTHVQKLMSTIKSDMTKSGAKSMIKRTGIFDFGSSETVTPIEQVGFNYPAKGDKAKPI